MRKVKKQMYKDERKPSHQEIKNEESDDENQDSNEDEFRALYLDKEKENKYIFNPKETNSFENQNEFKGSGEYSVNLSKDHTNHLNEEKEQSFFQKLFNVFFTQKLLSILTALLTKLLTVIDSLLPTLAGRSKTRYKVISSLLKLLIKIQMMLSLRLMQMLILINQKLIEFEEKYIGGSGTSREKQDKLQNINPKTQDRERSREQYRSFEIGNREEVERSSSLEKAIKSYDRENNIAPERDQWQRYQDISVSLSKNIENKVELSKITDKDSHKRNEDFVAKYMQKQEYLRLTGYGEEKNQFRSSGSLLSQLLGIANIVYNKTKEFVKNHFSEYNIFDSRNTNSNHYEAKFSYRDNHDKSGGQEQNKNDFSSPKFNNIREDDTFQLKDYAKLEQRGRDGQFGEL